MNLQPRFASHIIYYKLNVYYIAYKAHDDSKQCLVIKWMQINVDFIVHIYKKNTLNKWLFFS